MAGTVGGLSRDKYARLVHTPPLTIASDQEAAAALLGDIAALCSAQGAQWHPHLRAEVAGGAMRLWAPPGP